MRGCAALSGKRFMATGKHPATPHPSASLTPSPARGEGRQKIGLAFALLLIPAPTLADTIASPRADKVAVTLYRGDSGPFQALDEWEREQAMRKGLILVTETRTVFLPAGRHTLRFDGVADGLIAQSAAVEGLPGAVVERNYDYALLSPGTLLERSLNQPVKIVRTNRKTGRQTTETAVVRQGPDGVVLQTATGVEALGCSGGAERLVFDQVPSDLSDKPALSTLIDVPAPTQATLTLSYLAIGVNWQADYVARIRPDGRSLDLTGWLTLVNSGGTSFVDAPTQAVAGKLAREEVEVKTGEAKPIRRDCWPMDTTTRGRLLVAPDAMAARAPPSMALAAPVGMFDGGLEEVVVTGQRAKLAEQSELGDYKLYTLPEPVTVGARQTKQVAFLDQKAVAFQRLYVFTLDTYDDYDDPEEHRAAQVVLRLENKPGEGLGKPLPSGALAVMETTGGRPAFAGEQAMRDVAVGQPFDLAIGDAMDVQTRPRLIKDEARGKNRTRRTYEIDLANAKSAPITVEVRCPTGQEGFKLISAPGKHDVRDGDLAWRFGLDPGGRRTVRYVVEYEG
jgi:hypothetical protein